MRRHLLHLFHSSLPVLCVDLVRGILNFDTQQRATAQDILQHPWLAAQGVAPDKPLDNVVITRLRNFAGMTRLRKAAILAAASNLRCSALQQLEQGAACKVMQRLARPQTELCKSRSRDLAAELCTA